MTLSARLDDLAARFSDKVAIHDLGTGTDLTFSELRLRADAAASIIGRYVPSGETFAVLSRNRFEMIVLLYAAARLGLRMFPINWRLSQAEISAQIADCDASLIIQEEELAFRLPRPVPALEIGSLPTTGEAPTAQASDEDIVLVVYTSGSSGKPKGVLLSQRALVYGARNYAAPYLLDETTVMLCDMPLFHVAGLCAAANAPLLMGGTVRISDQFDLERTSRELANGPVTHYFSVPQMAEALANVGDISRYKHLRSYTVGGAPVADELLRFWHAAGVNLTNGYGLSEACGAVSGVDMKAFDPVTGDVTCGPATPHAELQVMLESGQRARTGRGEILVRSNSAFSGYHRQVRHDPSDWFHTGDFGELDCRGNLRLIGRLKEMYISGGENVYPAEVEAVLITHPGIRECCIVGVADAKWGQVGLAYYVSDADLSQQDLSDFCASSLGRFKVPAFFERMDALPRTATGKVDRAALEALS